MHKSCIEAGEKAQKDARVVLHNLDKIMALRRSLVLQKKRLDPPVERVWRLPLANPLCIDGVQEHRKVISKSTILGQKIKVLDEAILGVFPTAAKALPSMNSVRKDRQKLKSMARHLVEIQDRIADSEEQRQRIALLEEEMFRGINEEQHRKAVAVANDKANDKAIAKVLSKGSGEVSTELLEYANQRNLRARDGIDALRQEQEHLKERIDAKKKNADGGFDIYNAEDLQRELNLIPAKLQAQEIEDKKAQEIFKGLADIAVYKSRRKAEEVKTKVREEGVLAEHRAFRENEKERKERISQSTQNAAQKTLENSEFGLQKAEEQRREQLEREDQIAFKERQTQQISQQEGLIRDQDAALSETKLQQEQFRKQWEKQLKEFDMLTSELQEQATLIGTQSAKIAQIQKNAEIDTRSFKENKEATEQNANKIVRDAFDKTTQAEEKAQKLQLEQNSLLLENQQLVESAQQAEKVTAEAQKELKQVQVEVQEKERILKEMSNTINLYEIFFSKREKDRKADISSRRKVVTQEPIDINPASTNSESETDDSAASSSFTSTLKEALEEPQLQVLSSVAVEKKNDGKVKFNELSQDQQKKVAKYIDAKVNNNEKKTFKKQLTIKQVAEIMQWDPKSKTNLSRFF